MERLRYLTYHICKAIVWTRSQTLSEEHSKMIESIINGKFIIILNINKSHLRIKQLSLIKINLHSTYDQKCTIKQLVDETLDITSILLYFQIDIKF